MAFSLVDYINSDSDYFGNYILVSEGGMGKTTQLKYLHKSIVDGAVNGKKLISVYIDAKKMTVHSDDLIAEYISLNYFNGAFSLKSVSDMLSSADKADNYRFFIIIDAINEAPDSVIGNIINQADKYYKASDSNTRFIISSSTYVNAGVDFKKIELCPFDDDYTRGVIKRFFGKGELNQSLCEILRIPMFLSVFINTFNGKNIPAEFTNKNSRIRRSDLLEAYVCKLLSESLSPRDEAAIKELAFFMAAKGIYAVKRPELKRTDRENADYLCRACSMLVKTSADETFSFSHRYWRDFFAAKFFVDLINDVQISDLETPVDADVISFAGELIKNSDGLCECDFANKTNTLSPTSPTEDFLHENKLLLNKHPAATANLIELMKAARGNFVTADFSGLDLSNASFVNCDLPNSKFENALISANAFMPDITLNDNDMLRSAFTENGRFFCILDNNNNLAVYSCENGQAYMMELSHYTDDSLTISGNRDSCIFLRTSNFGERFVFAVDCENRKICKINDTEYQAKGMSLFTNLRDLRCYYNDFNAYLSLNKRIKVSRFNDETVLAKCKPLDIPEISDFSMATRLNTIVSEESYIVEREVRFTKEQFGDFIAFSKNSELLASRNAEHILIWDCNTLSVKHKISTAASLINDAVLANPNGPDIYDYKYKINPDGEMVFRCTDGRIRKYNCSDKKLSVIRKTNCELFVLDNDYYALYSVPENSVKFYCKGNFCFEHTFEYEEYNPVIDIAKRGKYVVIVHLMPKAFVYCIEDNKLRQIYQTDEYVDIRTFEITDAYICYVNSAVNNNYGVYVNRQDGLKLCCPLKMQWHKKGEYIRTAKINDMYFFVGYPKEATALPEEKAQLRISVFDCSGKEIINRSYKTADKIAAYGFCNNRIYIIRLNKESLEFACDMLDVENCSVKSVETASSLSMDERAFFAVSTPAWFSDNGVPVNFVIDNNRTVIFSDEIRTRMSLDNELMNRSSELTILPCDITNCDFSSAKISWESERSAKLLKFNGAII